MGADVGRRVGAQVGCKCDGVSVAETVPEITCEAPSVARQVGGVQVRSFLVDQREEGEYFPRLAPWTLVRISAYL